MTPAPQPLRFPQLAVACPWCHAPADNLCAGQRNDRPRRADTHEARRHAWTVAVAVCPTCQVEPGTLCRHPDTGRSLPVPHPDRDTEAVRTQPPARRPRIANLGTQLDLTREDQP